MSDPSHFLFPLQGLYSYLCRYFADFSSRGVVVGFDTRGQEESGCSSHRWHTHTVAHTDTHALMTQSHQSKDVPRHTDDLLRPELCHSSIFNFSDWDLINLLRPASTYVDIACL